MVLEYVEGGDCAALLKNTGGPLPLDLARYWPGSFTGAGHFPLDISLWTFPPGHFPFPKLKV